MSDKNLPTPIFTPRTFQEAREFAQFVSKTNFVPKDYKDKPDEILACIQYGSEVGLSPMQALQSIAVINGRPSLFGDASLALVMASGLLEYIKEYEQEDGTAICEVKRKGDPEPHITKWSKAQTVTAGLANGNVHKLYPERMRQMRARGFCLRDKFADVLRGLISEDEAIDVTPPKGELSPEETPRARVVVKPDEGRQEDVKVEGVPLESETTSGGTPVADGDYPTAEEVRQEYVNSPLTPKERYDRIEQAIPDFKLKGYTKLDGPDRKKVMEALRR